jgi:hypothetical protein
MQGNIANLEDPQTTRSFFSVGQIVAAAEFILGIIRTHDAALRREVIERESTTKAG